MLFSPNPSLKEIFLFIERSNLDMKKKSHSEYIKASDRSIVTFLSTLISPSVIFIIYLYHFHCHFHYFLFRKPYNIQGAFLLSTSPKNPYNNILRKEGNTTWRITFQK